jgi:chaperonin cofactor prefoldin
MLEEANDALELEVETLEAEIDAIESMNADTQRLLELKSARLQALENQP